MMNSMIGKMKLISMLAVSGFMLLSVETVPGALPGLTTMTLGFDKAIADEEKDDEEPADNNLVCDCSNTSTALDKAEKEKKEAEDKIEKADSDKDQAEEDQEKAKKEEEEARNSEAEAVTDEEKQEAEDDLKKADEDKQKAEDDLEQAVEDKQKAEDDLKKADEDKEKAEDDLKEAKKSAPCTCGNGTMGFWKKSGSEKSTPPGGSPPKKLRQIQGQ